ncbi:MAG TPA: glycosyltransferase family 39 protein [Solirubrobacteraceae bacterium]
MGTIEAPGTPTGSTLSEGSQAHTGEGSPRLNATAIILALTALGAILRFATLDVQSIWLDESATMILVHRGLDGLLSHLPSSESAPPLYYVLVWAWTKVFGAGVLGFRSFSALIGTVTIPVMYLAGRRFSPRIGLWAAALTTVNPAMYYYSQEARAYALLILFSAAAFALWQRALQEPTTHRLALWSGLSILALLTHYFAVFLFIPEAVILARRLHWRRVAIPAGAVVLVGLALVPLALRERADGKSNWIQSSSLLSRLAQVPKQYLIGLYGPLEIYSTLLAGLLAAGAIVLLIRRGEEREKRLARDVAVVMVAALGLPALLALTHALDIFNGRNVMATWPVAAVLVAAGLGIVRAGRSGALLGAGLCAISLLVIFAIDTTPGYQRDDWRGVARTLQAPAADRVIVAPEHGSSPLYIYMPSSQNLTTASTATHEVAFVALRTQHTGHAPYPPVVPSTPPPGFHLVDVHRTEAFAVARFRAPASATVSVSTLRRLSGEAKADVFLQR